MAFAKRSKLMLIALTVVALALIFTAIATTSVNQSINSLGTITTSLNIGVYSDSGCTKTMTSIDWGAVAAGGTATQIAYIKNTAGSGTMTISLATSNWSPSGANTYITISWNQQNTQLTAGQSVAAIITLGVSPSINSITIFSNTITITGIG